MVAQRKSTGIHSPGNHPGEASPSEANVAIDTVSGTLPHPGTSPTACANQIRGHLFQNVPVQLKVGNGHFGFPVGLHLLTAVSGRTVRIGSLYVGEQAQAHRWMFHVPGQGCRLIDSWVGAHSFLCAAKAKVTRVDLCKDFPNGEFTIDGAVTAYQEDLFSMRGRRPTCRQYGDWLERKMGRTLYIGRAENGKAARVYEKGKQLGQLDSPWVRAEVTFTAKGKDIPLDVLLFPDRYFAGAYPAFARLSGAAAEVIPARRKERAVELSRKLYHLRKAYGATVSQALMTEGCTPEDLVDQLAQPLSTGPSEAGAEGVTWKEVKNELNNY